MQIIGQIQIKLLFFIHCTSQIYEENFIKKQMIFNKDLQNYIYQQKSMSEFSFEADYKYKIQCKIVQSSKIYFKATYIANSQNFFFQQTFSEESLQKDIKKFIGQTVQELFSYLNEDPQSLIGFDQQGGVGILTVKMVVCKKQKKCQLKLIKKQAQIKSNPKIQFLSVKKIQDQNQPNPQQQLQSQLAVIDMQIDEYQKTIKILNQNLMLKDKKVELYKKQNQVLKLKIKNMELSLKQQPEPQIKQPAQIMQSSIVASKIQVRGKYQQHINQGQNQLRRLFLKSQKINDKEVKQIMKYSWTDIQILSLGDNFISDDGFKTLFQKKQWPLLQKVYLQNNHIKQLNYLHQLPQMKRLSINDNMLEKTSAVYLTKCCFVSLNHLEISFKKDLNTQCWKIILKQNFQMFPSLSRLNYEQKQDVSQEVKQNILAKCNQMNILLNQADENGIGNLGNLLALMQLKSLLQQQ